MARGRDIKVVSHDGNLINIQETVGYYDPLQYPLLFPFGTYGWDLNTKNHTGQNISCREYYSYMLQVTSNIIISFPTIYLPMLCHKINTHTSLLQCRFVPMITLQYYKQGDFYNNML